MKSETIKNMERLLERTKHKIWDIVEMQMLYKSDLYKQAELEELQHVVDAIEMTLKANGIAVALAHTIDEIKFLEDHKDDIIAKVGEDLYNRRLAEIVVENEQRFSHLGLL